MEMDTNAKLTDMGAWREILIDSGSALAAQVAEFLPQLLAASAILLVGWLVARAIEIATGRILRRLGLDRAAARLQLASLLEQSEIRQTASQIVAKAVFWIVLLTAFLSSVETIGLTAVTATIDRLIAYIPSLIGAGLIALLGVLAARVTGSVVRSGAVAAGLQSAARLGQAAQWSVVVLVAIVAAEQLGVATEILIAPLTAIVGAITLSAGLAFALGARPIVTHILAGHFLRQSLPKESLVVVDGEQGLVESVGATETRLRSETKSWTVPNARLLDDVVTWV
jgi:hypothetical protein